MLKFEVDGITYVKPPGGNHGPMMSLKDDDDPGGRSTITPHQQAYAEAWVAQPMPWELEDG